MSSRHWHELCFVSVTTEVSSPPDHVPGLEFLKQMYTGAKNAGHEYWRWHQGFYQDSLTVYKKGCKRVHKLKQHSKCCAWQLRVFRVAPCLFLRTCSFLSSFDNQSSSTLFLNINSTSLQSSSATGIVAKSFVFQGNTGSLTIRLVK